MSGQRSDDANSESFEVSVEPAPKTPVFNAEEDEEAKRQRDAALASTFDPERAHFGKTDEELIAERGAEARALGDVAIAVGVAVAVLEAHEHEDENVDVETADPSDDGGD